MKQGKKIAVLIPALNEEETIGIVLEKIPGWVDTVVVADNGSTDQTAKIAAKIGAEVAYEPRRGYGSACLAAMSKLPLPDTDDAPHVVVFLDGDFSDDPTEMDKLLDPLLLGDRELVIGSRVKGICEKGSLSQTQQFGNWLSCLLTNRFFGVEYSDLGPYRAIKWSSLHELKMDDKGYGWTIQMQVRAARFGMKIAEVPVNYRRRAAGKSKVSGTIRGVMGAGTTIIFTIFSEALHEQKDRALARLKGLVS